MNYIKSYKLFTESIGFGDNVTGIGADEATFDHSNSPVLKQQVIAYVDNILYSNRGKLIFDLLGIEQPKDLEGAEMDDMYDTVKEKAIKYFMKHPHKMIDEEEMDVNPMPIDANSTNTDGIPRVTHGH